MCPLCKEHNYEGVFHWDNPDKYERAIGVSEENYSRDLFSCRNCGSLFQTGGCGRIEDVYSSEYRSEDFRGESQDSLFDRIAALPRIESENLARLDMLETEFGALVNLEAPLRMLDIGSGLGIFPWAVAAKFPHLRIRTVDPDQSSCDLLLDKVTQTVGQHHMECRAESYRAGLFNKFNLVTALHVIEHMRDPDEFIAEVVKDMLDDALFYIEAPDALSVHVVDDKDHDKYNSCHYFLPSAQGLCVLLRRHGLESVVLRRVRTVRKMVNLACIAASPAYAAGARSAVLPK